MKYIKTFAFLMTIFGLTGCPSTDHQTIVPAIVPNSQKTEAPKPRPNIIGAIEPIYILPMKSAFEARIDTGAATSSIDVSEIHEFERDGQKWVSFKIVNRRSGEELTFEKPIVKTVTIRRIEVPEQRIKVMLPIMIGGKKFTTEFTLADRTDFQYQALVGRNILTGKFIVDTAVSHTLK